MFSNFSNFLSNSLRILNIANRALPLVREMSPTIKTLKNKLSNTNLPRLSIAPINNNNKNINTNNIKKEIPQRQNSTLTFFQ